MKLFLYMAAIPLGAVTGALAAIALWVAVMVPLGAALRSIGWVL